MSRARRLLDLIQVLRRNRFPVAGAALASELGISLRTLYRDIATLKEQGACIDGEPGLGYLLRPGFLLPPLMFHDDEIEALVLGSRWVSGRSQDPRLAAAARNALVKIGAVLPSHLRAHLDTPSLLLAPGERMAAGPVDLGVMRQAIRSEHKAAIRYRDLRSKETERIVWPLALAVFDKVLLLVAWCETREGFRSFRADRIESFTVSDSKYPGRRQVLLERWRRQRS